jgi:biopolymer transport protein TolR
MGAQLQGGGGSGRRVGLAGGRSRAYRPMADINVTPFVDVMLVLLVVFMVTAPLLTSGVPIDLPQSDAKPINEDDNKPLEISIDGNGTIFIGEEKVKQDRLVNMLAAMTNNDPERRIFIRADQGLDYGRVMKVLGALNGAGFRKVALLSDTSTKRP